MPSALAAIDRAADTKPDGFISGIASSPVTDSFGHKVLPHAFSGSIAKRGLSGPQGVKLLANHSGMPVGKILSLRTVGADLRIEAELNLDLQSVRDLHSTILHSGGLNFSVGFALGDHEVLDKPDRDGAWLIIQSGDLMEVSVVCFGACPGAQMDFAKSASSDTYSEIQRRIAAIRTHMERIAANG